MLNKKSVSKLMTNALGGLVLAAAAIIFIFIFGGKLLDFFLSTNQDEATRNNAREIILQINTMLKNKDLSIETPYYIGKDFNLVGFPKVSTENPKIIKSTCDDEKFKRPDICGNRACLCLFDGETPTKHCQSYEEDIMFVASDNIDDELFFGQKNTG